ncbi:hypothetical protein C8A03DRAFT_18879 [Achaetomium macrosporum]|uniref:Uncharacterized protein n=1 Tax=Achaetomium macrosporum TaxID=79813 RepID=A0AAN7H493_9PEZI|nr:hypothetical protein C8A03DRAFT_18879 [Achaetomium macrosporum]
MAQPPPSEPPEQPVLKRDGFSIRGTWFGVEGEPRLEGDRLLELFFPERLRLKRDQKRAAEDARAYFKKAFFAAQLRWYGIPFKANAKVSDLRQLLRDAVLAGKCSEVPESVKELERAMRRDYEPAFRDWAARAAAWEAEQQEWKDAAWEKCSTPAERATQDLDRFLSYYFLTDGRPDPSKTKEPLALYGFEDRFALHRKAERILGLETVSGGEGEMRTICIGWDRTAVWRLAQQIDSRSWERQKEKERALWDDAMEEHRRLVEETRQQGGPKVVRLSPEPHNLQKCKGSYIIRCERVAEEYPSQSLFTLDVGRGRGPNPRVLDGALGFSFFQGTMLLALEQDREWLDEFVGDSGSKGEEDDEEEEAPSEDDDHDEPDYQDGDTDNDDEVDEESDDGGDEEGDEADERSHVGSTKKRKTAWSGMAHERPKKKAKSAARRLSILLRGRETGMGEILPEPEGGYLEFLDDMFTHFKGKVDLPYVGKAVEIEGFKVALRAKRAAEPWENFSEDAYEYARVARWR